MEQSAKDRLLEFLKYLKIGQSRFEKTVGISNAYVTNLKSSPSAKVIRKISAAYPELNTGWLLTGEGDMIKRTHRDAPDGIPMRPRVPASVMAGFTGGAEDQVMVRDCELVPAIPLFRSYDFTIAVRGDSMAPNYLSGDEVAVKQVRDKTFIEWGEVYVVVTTEGAVLKRLFKSDDPTKIICVSYNPDYAPFEIDATSLRAIYKVVGLIRQI